MANNWYGYTGKMLEVDLSAQSTAESELDVELAEAYMGGKGFGARILYDRLPVDCDP